MRHTFAFFSLFLLNMFYCLAQQNEGEGMAVPAIEVKSLLPGEKPVRISDVKIDVKVVGSLAVTTVDMTFFNPNIRILEGELQFPLAEGQSVSRFALDINGKLREGVVVEKAKGQQAFESVIRQGIDPGLLEKTQGNNFKTRVYPLPSNGNRRVVIAYEQELPRQDGNYRFFLPVEYRDNLNSFDLNINVFANGNVPQVDKSPWGNFSFNKSGDAYTASYSAKNYPAKGQIVFSLPVKDKRQLFVEKGQVSGKNIFYSQVFPAVIGQPKDLPSHIALFWDVSSSMEKRDFKLEEELLSAYFREIGNVTVDLYTFNCILAKPLKFTIKNGNWAKLKAALQNVAYDGATQFGMLDFTKVKADEILLFSDGLSNFGKLMPITGNIPVSVISSNLSADHSMLRFISSSTGGKYINLLQETPREALHVLKSESYRLISAEYNKNHITDFTTSGTVIKPAAGFSMAGRLNVPRTEVTLHFGTGNNRLYTETVIIEAKDSHDYGNIVERIWAAKKIAELDMLYEKNKEEIESLGREYNIVTRNTSLIVLDRVEDYVQYRITPPSELLDMYNRLVNKEINEEKSSKERQISKVISMFEDRKTWWNKAFVQDRPKRDTWSGSSSLQGSIRGTVTDEEGEVLIGVNVLVKGTRVGTMTDVDGKYAIDALRDEILVFSYLGYDSKEVRVANNSTINVVLASSRELLEEVVIVGYGSQKRADISYSVATISEEYAPSPPLIAAESPVEYEEISELNDEVNHLRAIEEGNQSDRRRENVASVGKIALKAWTPDAPYIEQLKNKKDKELYGAYLSIRGEYKSTPSFFLDVATLFEQRGLKEEALIILSNLAELEVQNYRLLRVLAHRLKQLGYTGYAIDQFEVVLKLRPEEPQSYRDLALTYSQDKEYQKAIDTMYKIVERSWDSRFPQIELIAAGEINDIIFKAQQAKMNLNLDNINEWLIYNTPVDIRVVLNWDTDNSDMDLWVTDPYNEKCYYSNRETRIGGFLSRDFTGGYGPEEFMIRKAVKGKYKIQVDYYGSREQTIIGPTTIYLDIYTYYASGKEKKETITLRLSQKKEVIDVGEVSFEIK